MFIASRIFASRAYIVVPHGVPLTSKNWIRKNWQQETDLKKEKKNEDKY